MRALVTGTGGFIGSHVVDSCLDLGMEVVATDGLSGGFRENVADTAEFHEGDIRDASFVSGLMEHGPTTRSITSPRTRPEGLSHFIRAYNHRTNLEASALLINEAHEVPRFVFTSSIAVYGRNQLPMSEDMVPMTEDPCGISEYAVELDLASAHELFGLEYTIFRPHNVYGAPEHLRPLPQRHRDRSWSWRR
jgi:UDP-glucose 4-epimerase